MTSTTVFFIFIPILVTILLAVNLILAPHSPYLEKDSPFECGFHSFLGQSRTQFTISFFAFGLMFLIFDIELVIIYPHAMAIYNNESLGLFVLIIFLIVVTVGFVFEYGKGALKIYSKQNNSTDYNVLKDSVK